MTTLPPRARFRISLLCIMAEEIGHRPQSCCVDPNPFPNSTQSPQTTWTYSWLSFAFTLNRRAPTSWSRQTYPGCQREALAKNVQTRSHPSSARWCLPFVSLITTSLSILRTESSPVHRWICHSSVHMGILHHSGAHDLCGNVTVWTSERGVLSHERPL